MASIGHAVHESTTRSERAGLVNLLSRILLPLGLFAIALFGITVAKVFLVDLATLAGIYRIVAFFIVGIVLLFASFLYQRGRA